MVCPFLTGRLERKKYGRKWCRILEPLKDDVITMSQEFCMTQDRHLQCMWYYRGKNDQQNFDKWYKYWLKRGWKP